MIQAEPVQLLQAREVEVETTDPGSCLSDSDSLYSSTSASWTSATESETASCHESSSQQCCSSLDFRSRFKGETLGVVPSAAAHMSKYGLADSASDSCRTLLDLNRSKSYERLRRRRAEIRGVFTGTKLE